MMIFTIDKVIAHSGTSGRALWLLCGSVLIDRIDIPSTGTSS